jgi:Domain of unknown function (DUF4410)
MRKAILLAFLLTIGTLGLMQVGGAAETAVKDKYPAVQVDRFEIKEGVQFPVDYLLTLQEEIIKQLQESKQFQEVLRPGENPTDSATEVLRLTGTINHFRPGSRAKRYVVGFGAGSTEIYAHLTFVDRATGQTVLTQEVRGQMAGGFIGGESLNVTRDFAKKVVNSIKLVRETHLPAAGEVASNAAGEATRVDAAAAPEPNVDRHTVTISSADFDAGEKKLKEDGAAGYRLVEFAATGPKTAEAVLQKSGAPGEVFEYRLVRARLPGTLQKNLNKSAEESFHLCPHTLNLFGGMMTVVAEKGPASAKLRHEYRVHQAMRLSSAQKNVAKDQSEGFVLAETFEQSGGVHLIIMEKRFQGEGE